MAFGMGLAALVQKQPKLEEVRTYNMHNGHYCSMLK